MLVIKRSNLRSDKWLVILDGILRGKFSSITGARIFADALIPGVLSSYGETFRSKECIDGWLDDTFADRHGL